MEPRHARHRTKPPVPCPGLAGHCERTLKGTLLPSPDFLPATTPNLARNAINNCKGLPRPSFSPLGWFLREHRAASLEASITPRNSPERDPDSTGDRHKAHRFPAGHVHGG
jgi:hypothetical protein